MLRRVSFGLIMLMLSVVVFPLLPTEATPALQEETPPTAADLLPANTLTYLEFEGETLPDSLNLLLAHFLPESAQDQFPAQFFLLLTPYRDVFPWVGERIVNASFVPQGELLPSNVTIYQVRNPNLAAMYVENRTESGWTQQATAPDVELWVEDTALFPGAILSLPGYIVTGGEAGVRALLSDYKRPNGERLSESAAYQGVRETLVPDANLFAYLPGGLGFAVSVTESAFITESVRPELRLLPPGAPLDTAVVESVPIGALFVQAGSVDETDLGRTNAVISLLLEAIGLDIDAVLPYRVSQTLTDISTLIDGSYTAYLTYSRGTLYDLASIPLDGGFVVLPENRDVALSALTGVIIQALALDVPLETVSPFNYVLPTPGESLPDIYLGVQGTDRFYVSTESGSEAGFRAFEGRNLTRDPRWNAALAYLPEGAHRVTYVNFGAFIALTNEFLSTMPNLNVALVSDLLTYLERFESASRFIRYDENGGRLDRFVLLFGE